MRRRPRYTPQPRGRGRTEVLVLASEQFLRPRRADHIKPITRGQVRLRRVVRRSVRRGHLVNPPGIDDLFLGPGNLEAKLTCFLRGPEIRTHGHGSLSSTALLARLFAKSRRRVYMGASDRGCAVGGLCYHRQRSALGGASPSPLRHREGETPRRAATSSSAGSSAGPPSTCWSFWPRSGCS